MSDSAPFVPLSPTPGGEHVASGALGESDAVTPGTFFAHADFEAWWQQLCTERPELLALQPKQKLRDFLFRDLRDAMRDAFEAAREITTRPL